MSTILRNLAKIQEKAPLIILLIVLTFTLFMGYYAVQIKTNSSFDTMFSKESNTQQMKRIVSNEFGSTDMLFVLFEVDPESSDSTGIQDIREPAVLEAMLRLSKTIETEPTVAGTWGVPHLMLMNYGRLPATLEESKEMIEALDGDSFFGNGYTITNLLIQVDIGKKAGSLERIETIINDKIEDTTSPPGTRMVLTGMPTLINRIMTLLINDNIRTIGIALIAVFFILWYFFRDVRIAFFSVLPVVLTLIWLAGTLTLMGIHITFMIASVGAMMVGIGIDYSIHLTHSFHDRIKKGEKKPTEEAVASIGSALVASALTTIAGFAAMLLGDTPNSIIQGTVLSIGVTYAFIATLIALPPMLILQRRYIYSEVDEVVFSLRSKKREPKKGQITQKILSKLASVQARRPGTIIIAVIILTVLIIPGFGFVRLDTDNENWIPDNDPTIEDFGKLTTAFGGLDSQNFLVMLKKDAKNIPDMNRITDLRDPRVLAQLSMLDETVSDLSFVDSVDSPTIGIKKLNRGRIPADYETIKNIVEDTPQIRQSFNRDYSIIKLTLWSDEFEMEDYDQILREVDSISLPEEVEIVPQGGLAEDVEMEEELGADTMKVSLIGFILVIIVASLFYRSVIAGLLAFVPIIFAIIWTIGTMGWIDLPFTVLTTGMLAILMGIGIDFSIHIIHATKEKLEEGKSMEDSLFFALTSTGEAISMSTLTTVSGFMALAFASLLATQRLGYTLALGIICTYVSCMLIVPAVLALQHKLKQKKQQGG